MEAHKKKVIYLFGLLLLGVLLPAILTFSQVQAGAPEIREECRGPDGRPIRSLYDSSLPKFAEARMLSRAEQREAKERGVSAYVIVVNPERYYLGRYTQIWLYRRQCARIQMIRENINKRNRQLHMGEEYDVDCMAVQAMQEDKRIRFSQRTIDSIERDIERLLVNERWYEVLPGPQRRVALKRCVSFK
jgi:hypothetical protein